MPAILNWLLRLLPTNPLCIRLVAGGSRRWRHLVIRGLYLAIMITVILFMLLGSLGGSSMSFRALAAASASIFEFTCVVQIILVCLLTPVFMAGAIVHESNPRTWDILLTTPLNSLQVVLGNLFGRYFFILALLVSSLPLFALLQMFGGVPGSTILANYGVAACSALIVAAIAVTLSATRTGGRRAVFIFYVLVVVYLTGTMILDSLLTTRLISGGSTTTVMTAINPFLAIQAMLNPTGYVIPDTYGESWLIQTWMGKPVTTFNWLCVILSLILVIYSTLRVRILAFRSGDRTWLQRLFRITSDQAISRQPRLVGNNPIAWRESHLRRSVSTIIGRWGFLVVGLLLLIILLAWHSTSTPGPTQTQNTRLFIVALLIAETIIIILTAVNLSATAVSREREDGSLDLILTTPIQPGPYLTGKHRGLIRYLLPMMALPIISMLLIACYVMLMGTEHVQQTETLRSGIEAVVPLVMPATCFAFALMFIPFVAFCVMVGLHWSIRSKGTIGSIAAAVIILLILLGILGTCGFIAGANIPMAGAALMTLNPGNLILSIADPTQWLYSSWRSDSTGFNISIMMVIGGVLSAGAYLGLVWTMHRSMSRTFMMTVRRLSGTS
ncbi:MAG: hypothetical protein CMJ39_05480 [Phycisphaerae bacterium]|nr:hypothetical protein [Phycisphaerae bacterium]